MKKLDLQQTENGYEGTGYFISKVRTQNTELEKESDNMFTAIGTVELRVDKFIIKDNTLHIIVYTDDKIEKYTVYARFTKNCDIDYVKDNEEVKNKIEDYLHSRVDMTNLVEVFINSEHTICVLFFMDTADNQVSIIEVPMNLVFSLVDL